MYNKDVAGCDQILELYNKIQKYEEDVLARPDAKEFIEGQIRLNKVVIDRTEKQKIDAWNGFWYFSAGGAANFAAQKMGLAPPYNWDGFDTTNSLQNEPVEEILARDPYAEKYATDLQVEDQSDSNRNPFAPAAWISGWYYGLSGHDK